MITSQPLITPGTVGASSRAARLLRQCTISSFFKTCASILSVPSDGTAPTVAIYDGHPQLFQVTVAFNRETKAILRKYHHSWRVPKSSPVPWVVSQESSWDGWGMASDIDPPVLSCRHCRAKLWLLGQFQRLIVGDIAGHILSMVGYIIYPHYTRGYISC